MPDRLAELRRQRALIAEHLAWLDREIATAAANAAEQASTTEPNTAAVLVEPSASASFVPLTAPAAPPLDAAAVLASIKADGAEKPTATGPTDSLTTKTELGAPAPDKDQRDVRTETRKGCFLYLLIASAATALGVWLLIWASHSAWVKEEAGPYIVKATVLALILALGASLRSLIAKFRSK